MYDSSDNTICNAYTMADLLVNPCALTISPSLAPLKQTKVNIDRVISWMKFKCPKLIIEVPTYELKSKTKHLHFHCLAYLPFRFYRRLITNYPGWSIRLKPLTDQYHVERWVSYLLKVVDHPIRQQQVFFEHDCLNQYMFHGE